MGCWLTIGCELEKGYYWVVIWLLVDCEWVVAGCCKSVVNGLQGVLREGS